jgi:hypothetical protein
MNPFSTAIFTLAFGAIATAAPDAAPGVEKPITADNGPIGTLLREWDAAGTAAGNVDDWYDNRDRGHSMLNLAPYPQLQIVEYSESDRKASRDWALQGGIRPGVVFGNSSTSATPTTGGSNPRRAYVSSPGVEFLYNAYRLNNLYIYPAHHDYHPGHNGLQRATGSFYGDLYPVNTPYFIISQGSSGSDQPFMKAVAFCLAAFRPEVKSTLVSEGMLMPAIQMIFRMSNKQVSEPADYLTGKAHPPVFRGEQVDALKMVKLAHEIDLKHLPPLAVLRVVEEDSAEAGRDFFEPLLTEALADTPCVIARVHRSVAHERRFVLSADRSSDVNKLPLTFHWVLLRGDPAKVKINLRDKAGTSAEIVIPYHERAPIAPGDSIESNRVDVGLFVNNGTHYSPPAFFTSFTLDSEARTYDSGGRPLEIAYSMGESVINVSNWQVLFDAFKAAPPAPGIRILTEGWAPADIAAATKLGEDYKTASSKAAALGAERKDADAAVQKATPETKKDLVAAAKKAREAEEAATKSRDDLLTEKQPGADLAFKPRVLARLESLLNDPGFYQSHRAALPPAVAGVKRLVALGIAKSAGENDLELLPVLPGDKPAVERLSRYQKAMLAQLNGEILAAAIPGVRHEFCANLVDFRLATPKTWRDVYLYSIAGTPLGWTRYDGTAVTDFNARGQIVESRDGKGRCLTARSVVYDRKRPQNFDPRSGPDRTPLSFSPGFRTYRYEYENDSDEKGRMTEVADPK